MFSGRHTLWETLVDWQDSGQGSEGLALTLYRRLWTNFISCVSPLCPNSREELSRVQRLQEAHRGYCALVRSQDHAQGGRAGHPKAAELPPKEHSCPRRPGKPGCSLKPPSLNDAGDTDSPEQARRLKTAGPAQTLAHDLTVRANIFNNTQGRLTKGPE